ncbi:MAG: D-alanyl-D-alanine carboxypeptidase family protein [Christensenellales bacterium]
MGFYKQYISRPAAAHGGEWSKPQRFMIKTGKWFAILLSCLMIFTILPQKVRAVTPETAFDVNADAAVLIDVGSGTVIYEKNGDQSVPSSGVFKTMSLLLIMEAMERGELAMDTMVTVSQHAAKQGGMSAFLETNEQCSAETLLKSVAMISANDACMALVEKISGSEEVFVARMNERAGELGLKNTVFMNATGAEDAGQHSTAKDLAVISKELVKYDKLLKSSKQYMETLKHGDGRISELTNPNRLVRFYPGCDGLQTGSNQKAKYCVSATALRDNQRYIAVVTGADNNAKRSEAASKLLDYGFANYTSVLLVRKNEIIKKAAPVKGGIKSAVTIVAKDQLALLLGKGSERGIMKEIEIEENLAAPLAQGQKVGVLRFVKDGVILAQTDIITEISVDKADIIDYILRILGFWF